MNVPLLCQREEKDGYSQAKLAPTPLKRHRPQALSADGRHGRSAVPNRSGSMEGPDDCGCMANGRGEAAGEEDPEALSYPSGSLNLAEAVQHHAGWHSPELEHLTYACLVYLRGVSVHTPHSKKSMSASASPVSHAFSERDPMYCPGSLAGPFAAGARGQETSGNRRVDQYSLRGH